MRHYNNILYVSHGSSDVKEGLKQALSLARNNEAPLKILVLRPEFPKDFPDFKDSYERTVLEQILDSVRDTKEALKIEKDTVDVSIEFAVDKTPAILIIKQVLQQGYDLVVKEADLRDSQGGFKAIDMDLLRKCPVPVWLCRPISKSRNEIKVAVAIDPDSSEPAAERLSLRLLQLSSSLAEQCNQQLQLISCWDYEFESALKHNVFIKMPQEEIDQQIEASRLSHNKALMELVNNSSPKIEPTIHHLRGKPAEIIPDFVNDQGIDILVMGTVARTGIAGFMIGNTAENVIQQLSCTLLALKPHGFVSPVKA